MNAEVLDHAVYRAVLSAMARPGTVQQLPAAAAGHPLLHLLGALLDHEALFHVLLDESLGREIRAATGGQPAPLDRADFVIFPDGRSGGLVRSLKRGSLEFPDEGATALYRVRGLHPDGGAVVLRGPGIRDRASPWIEGLAEDEPALLAEVNREFPLGVDSIFLDPGGRLMCLPRSTRIEVG